MNNILRLCSHAAQVSGSISSLLTATFKSFYFEIKSLVKLEYMQ